MYLRPKDIFRKKIVDTFKSTQNMKRNVFLGTKRLQKPFNLSKT